MPKSQIELALFNRVEAAKYLGVDRSYINHLIDIGELTEIHLPMRSSFKGRRIPKKSLEQFIDRLMQFNLNPESGIDHLINKYTNTKR